MAEVSGHFQGRKMTTTKSGAVIGRPDLPGNSDTWIGAVGDTVRGIRHQRGWSLVELSEKSGVEMTFISEFERGLRDISVGDLLRVCTAFGVDPSRLVKAKNAGCVNGELLGSMSLSWLAELCAVLGRNPGSVLGKVNEHGESVRAVRKRNRAEL